MTYSQQRSQKCLEPAILNTMWPSESGEDASLVERGPSTVAVYNGAEEEDTTQAWTGDSCHSPLPQRSPDMSREG